MSVVKVMLVSVLTSGCATTGLVLEIAKQPSQGSTGEPQSCPVTGAALGGIAEGVATAGLVVPNDFFTSGEKVTLGVVIGLDALLATALIVAFCD